MKNSPIWFCASTLAATYPKRRVVIQYNYSSLFSPLPRPTVPQSAKGVQAVQGHRAEPDRQRLLRAEGARDGAAGQHDRREEGELDAVRLAVLQAVAAERVLFVHQIQWSFSQRWCNMQSSGAYQGTDGQSGRDRGDRSRASIARHAATGGQEGEEVGVVGGAL